MAIGHGPTPGFGLISSSNFYVPQTPVPGSMASFVLPAAVPVHPAANIGQAAGLGQGDLFSGMNLPMNFNFVGGFFQYYWPYLVGGGLLLMLLARRR